MLLVDDRAGSVELLPFFPPETCKKIRLEAGDVAFFGYGPEGPYTMPIGIEYKTAKEALQCLHDGRLVGEQMPKLSQLYRRVYLVIEGEFKEGNGGELLFKGWSHGKPTWTSYSKTTYRQFDNWFNSIVEIGRVVVKRSVNRAETAAQIYNLYKFWIKDYEEHKSLLKFYKTQEPLLLTKPSLRRMVAAQIPSIGWELAARAAEHFPTVIDMINAGEEEWTNVKGIGKLKAQKIYRSLRAT